MVALVLPVIIAHVITKILTLVFTVIKSNQVILALVITIV